MIRPPGQPYLSATQIRRRVRTLAASIRKTYQNRPLTIVALLKGSVFFVVDLLRHLDPDTEVEFWNISSYEGTRSTGKIRGLHHCRGDFHGRDILLIDDILDSGLTLDRTRSHAKKLDGLWWDTPSGLNVCVQKVQAQFRRGGGKEI